MSNKIKCANCETLLQFPDEVRGKRVKCPKCDSAFRIPEDGIGNPNWLEMLSRLIYEMIYPAVLGSMIYQIVVDCFAENSQFLFSSVLQWLVVAIYLLDWAYTRNVREVKQKSAFASTKYKLSMRQRICVSFIDLLSSALFVSAFAVIGYQENFCWGITLINVIVFLYLGFHLNVDKFGPETISLGALLIAGIFSVIFPFVFGVGHLAFAFMVTIIFTYALMCFHRIVGAFEQEGKTNAFFENRFVRVVRILFIPAIYASTLLFCRSI